MKKPVNSHFFSSWGVNMAWVLGLVYADGCLTNQGSLCISSIDLEMLQNVRTHLESEHSLKYQKAPQVYALQIVDRQINADLMRLGITERKSKTVRLPVIPDEFFYHFLRGYFDGNGSVGIARQKRENMILRFTSGSRMLMVDIAERLQLPFSIQTNGGAFNLTYYDKPSHILGKRMYEGSSTTNRLERKYVKYFSHTQICPIETLMNMGVDVIKLGHNLKLERLVELWPLRNLPKSEIARITGMEKFTVSSMLNPKRGY